MVGFMDKLFGVRPELTTATIPPASPDTSGAIPGEVVTTPQSTETPPIELDLVALLDNEGRSLARLTAAVMIAVGKARPYGYDACANWIWSNMGKSGQSHYLLLVSEAARADKTTAMNTKFPRAMVEARACLDYMKKQSPMALMVAYSAATGKTLMFTDTLDFSAPAQKAHDEIVNLILR